MGGGEEEVDEEEFREMEMGGGGGGFGFACQIEIGSLGFLGIEYWDPFLRGGKEMEVGELWIVNQIRRPLRMRMCYVAVLELSTFGFVLRGATLVGDKARGGKGR